MNAIPAVYERGFFRPLDPVELPDGTKVVVETEAVAVEWILAARRRVFDCLSRSYDTAEPGNAVETHNDHQP